MFALTVVPRTAKEPSTTHHAPRTMHNTRAAVSQIALADLACLAARSVCPDCTRCPPLEFKAPRHSLQRAAFGTMEWADSSRLLEDAQPFFPNWILGNVARQCCFWSSSVKAAGRRSFCLLTAKARDSQTEQATPSVIQAFIFLPDIFLPYDPLPCRAVHVRAGVADFDGRGQRSACSPSVSHMRVAVLSDR